MSQKSLDRKGRWRCHTVAFRVSPEEREEIRTRARLCGMTLQEYIIQIQQSPLRPHRKHSIQPSLFKIKERQSQPKGSRPYLISFTAWMKHASLIPAVQDWG